MILDDSLFVRELIKPVVEAYGLYLVGETDNCSEASQLIATYQPHLAIVDLVLPNKNGLDFISETIQNYPRINIVACSTLKGEEIKRKAYFSGAKFFLEKPFTKETIGEAIRASISNMIIKGEKSG